MGVTLNIVTPSGTALSVVAPARRLILGRGPTCDVRLPYPDISAAHLELSANGDRWTVKDLGSRNGSEVNGEPLRPQHAVEIRDRATLRLGSVEVRVLLEAPDDPGAYSLTDTGGLLRKMVADAVAAQPSASLTADDGRVATIPNFAADVRPEGEDFRVDRYEDGFWVTPGGDTSVDGAPVPAGGLLLSHGMVISGASNWTFHDPLSAHLDELDDGDEDAADAEKPTPPAQGGLDMLLVAGVLALLVALALVVVLAS